MSTADRALQPEMPRPSEGVDAIAGARPDVGTRPILRRLGERVRALRLAQGRTVKEVSARAGLSARFVVLVEAGAGNVSVTRLEDLARALGTRPGDLLMEDETPAEASPKVSPRPAYFVALLGLRGAGKTTLGRAAAQKLGLPFLELDVLVSERAGLDLSTLFEIHGASYYRKLEREVLSEVLRSPQGAVVATGGGLVTDHATYEQLRRHALTVWLRARPEDHWNRVVAQGDARPMADRVDAMNELRHLLRARSALYEQADHVLDTSKLGPERALSALVKLAHKARKPWQQPAT